MEIIVKLQLQGWKIIDIESYDVLEHGITVHCCNPTFDGVYFDDDNYVIGEEDA